MDPRFHRAAAEAYTAEGALAVLLAGSASRGDADRFSDVDLYVVWDTVPSEPVRAAAIERAGGTVDAFWPTEDAWSLDELPFEIAHVSLAEAERTVADVVERHDPDPGLQLALSAFATGVPLAGEEVLAPLRDAALPYPGGLATAVVRAQAQIDFLWQLEAHLERANPLLAYAWVADAHRRLLYALLAANRVYFFGFKRLETVEARLPLAPPRVAERIRETYEDAPSMGERVRALAEETYDIVEQTVPDVDVDRLREILRYRRPQA